MKILVINPGSTSTKVALFDEENLLWDATLVHDATELRRLPRVVDQLPLRSGALRDLLKAKGVLPEELAAVVGRGGLLRPVEGGTYAINPRMLADAEAGRRGDHAANLGCLLAHQLAQQAGARAFVVDPISVDEFEPLARYSGHPLLERQSLSHALNIHAVARRAAEQRGVDFRRVNFVVAHLGGGISVCPVKAGRIIDTNDASSDGPFSPERTGGLPLQGFIGLCFSGKYTESQMRRLVMGEGGLVAYLGTSDAAEVERRIDAGDKKAHEVYEAMAYQIAKEIGAMATVLKGAVEAIVLTGGLAKSPRVVRWIVERVSFIAPVLVFPGEFEMQAMASGARRVLRGEEKARTY